MISYRLDHLSNRELLDGLTRVTCNVRHHMAEVLAHLAEVDRRRIYLEQGCSSLFTYAIEVLHFSEDEAGKRIQAARVARQYPVVFEMVAAGELHLTAVNLLAPHLTPEGHAGLLAAARHKSKRQVEELLAAHAPRPDAVTRLARLPAQQLGGSPAQQLGGSPAQQLARLPLISPSAGPMDLLGTASPGPSVTGPEVVDLVPISAPALATVVSGAAPVGSRPSVKPLAPGRYRLQLTLSDEGHRALVRARDLMRHQNPSGDVAVVVERAIVALADALEARKLGKLKRRKGRGSAAGGTGSAAGGTESAAGGAGSAASATGSAASAAGLAATWIHGVAQRCAPAAAVGRGASSAVSLTRSETPHVDRGAAPECRPAPGEHAPEQVAPPSAGACAEHAPPRQSTGRTAGGGEMVEPGPPAQPLLPLRAPASARVDRTSRTSGGDRVVDAHAPEAPEQVRDRRRSIGRELRRQVTERDDARCTFVSSSGRRCAEHGFLELHHTTPVARGGADTLDGLALLCRAHHRLVTLRDFGESHVRRCIEQRSASARAAPRHEEGPTT